MALLLGVDAGTTNMKAALFHEDGRMLAVASEEYTLLTPAVGRAEFDAETYWHICCRVIRNVVKSARVRPESVTALAISSQGETLIRVDAQGASLGNAIVWLDNRSHAEAELIAAELGTQHAFEVTGQPEIVSTWPATKILWLRRNEPSSFAETARFLLLEDFLILRLTGRYAGERSLYSSSMLMDIRTGTLWSEMLSLLHIDSTRLPPLHDSGVIVGSVSDAAAQLTGLSSTTLVATGALDQVAGMVGSGNIAGGAITEATGTCLSVCVNTGHALNTAPGLRIPQHHGFSRGSYYSLLWSPAAGIVLKWFRDTFFRTPMKEGSALNMPTYDEMVDEAAKTPPGAEGLIMVPHLAGSGFPNFDPEARAGFSGFTLGHTRGHFTRAILESVAFLLRQAIEAVEQQGISVTSIFSIGGGSRNRLWNSIKADVTGKPIATIGSAEPACLGAAVLAGTGAGVFPSIAKACHSATMPAHVVQPSPDNRAVYESSYQAFLRQAAARER